MTVRTSWSVTVPTRTTNRISAIGFAGSQRDVVRHLLNRQELLRAVLVDAQRHLGAQSRALGSQPALGRIGPSAYPPLRIQPSLAPPAEVGLLLPRQAADAGSDSPAASGVNRLKNARVPPRRP